MAWASDVHATNLVYYYIPVVFGAWTVPRTWTAGETVTAAILNTDHRDNLNALRAGGIGIASQAALDFIYASSATQLARLAAGSALQIPRVNATATGWEFATLAQQVTLLKANSGTDASAGATNVDTFAMASGLTAKDTVLVVTELSSDTQQTAAPKLTNSTDSVDIVYLAGFPGGVAGNIAAGAAFYGVAVIGNAQNGTTTVASTNVGSGVTAGGTNTPITFTTAWTGAWTLALRHGGVTAGGTFRWRWGVFKLVGQ